jgi:hypothetical protein
MIDISPVSQMWLWAGIIILFVGFCVAGVHG